MAPPVEADKLKAMVKNPWNEEMLKKDIELLKLTKKHKEEQEYALYPVVELGGSADTDS